MPPTTCQPGRRFSLRDASSPFCRLPIPLLPFLQSRLPSAPYPSLSLPLLCTLYIFPSTSATLSPLFVTLDALRWKLSYLPAILPEGLRTGVGGTSLGLMETEGPEPPQLSLSLLLSKGRAVCLAPWRPMSWQHSPGGHSLPPQAPRIPKAQHWLPGPPPARTTPRIPPP